MYEEFTKLELEKMDIVDNACYDLIVGFCPNGLEDVDWNIEHISKIREALQEVLVDDMKLMTEMEFYPYREIGPDNENIIFEPSEMIISDREGKLSEVMEHTVNTLDAQEFADLVGLILGGECRYVGEYKYSFTPNSLYAGALDDIREKQNG
jgi:hypothetical protein